MKQKVQSQLGGLCIAARHAHILEVMVDVSFDPVVDKQVPFAVEHRERCAGPPVLTGEGGKGGG